MHEFRVRDLHLAAFIKGGGAEFAGFEDRHFLFRSPTSLVDWRVAHVNSCCRRIDLELVELRKFLRPAA